MSTPTPAPPWRGSSAPALTPSGPAWRAPTARIPYRPRWRKLALVAGLGLLALAVVTWVVFWIRPPAPARLVVLSANYDRTLAAPPNPYGKADARELAALARPGSWFGTRARFAGGSATSLTRAGLPDLSAVKEKCVVVFITAHGGRDRDGPFLFPEDATSEPGERVRFKTLLEQLARLPADKQKMLVIDAAREPAFTDLGLVHNDFAGGVAELDADIAAIPNLAVWLSSGLDERSWASPEWGTSSFSHFAMNGLNGGADADGNKRVTAGELVAFVTSRVSDWARDHRGARQIPVLLPKAEGEQRVRDMHLVSVDGPPAPLSAPEPFEPPPELEQQWQEYRALAQATPPPTAYSPHLWRQYEAWVLRYEQHVLAGDTEGAASARENAAELRRKIESARTLDISPQTLAIQSAVGGQRWKPWTPEVQKLFLTGIGRVAGKQPADRAKEWAAVRDEAGDIEANRLLWCRALVEWTAEEPLPRLPVARDLVPLVSDGLAIRPAELNFLSGLARHLPAASKAEVIGQLLKSVLHQRLKAEEAAAMLTSDRNEKQSIYPYAEFFYPWIAPQLARVDAKRREAEDLCFATDEASWKRASNSANEDYSFDSLTGWGSGPRDALVAWHCGAHLAVAEAEWVARWSTDSVGSRFAAQRAVWEQLHVTANLPTQPIGHARNALEGVIKAGRELTDARAPGRIHLAIETDALLKTKPEFDANSTPRADAVKWWNTAEAVLTAPPLLGANPSNRVALAREFRRVSRQLLITGETRPEALPEIPAAKARETAFETANRRGQLLLERFGGANLICTLCEVRPGEDYHALHERLVRFAFQADGRQSLAFFNSRCGELFDAVTARATKPDDVLAADRWVRIAPARAAVPDTPIDRVRRERVRGYLGYQAGRTFADHWYGEGDTRYYSLAVQRLTDDANAITAAFAPTDDPFKQYRVETPFPVAPKLPARIAITDEPNPTVHVPFAPHPTTGIDGFPVFWTDASTRTAVSTTPGATALTRSLTRPPRPQPLTPKAQTEALRVTGFFRGRTLDASCPVDFFAVPDRAAVSAPLPQTVGLAVRADTRALKRYGFGTGAVAIVLDCSGSMGRDPKDPTSVANYPTAVEALTKLLKELPPGTTINVWTFGQKTPGAKTPEDTIREVLPPTDLPIDFDAVVEDVLKQVRGLEPWHESPITRAVVRAKDRIKDAKVPFKAVVLISDAVDTRAATDPDYGEKKRTVSDVLRAEFPPSEVALGVAAFAVDKEEQPAQAEFKSAESFTPAGKFVSVKDIDVLIAWVRTGLNPRVRFALRAVGSDAPVTSLMAGTSEHDNWHAGKLAPGTYTLSVFGNTEFSDDIQLSPGDRLLLDLTENRGALSTKRHWFADTVPAIVKAGAPADSWRLALLQNGAKAGKLDLFTSIDVNPFVEHRTSVARIGDVWFEVTPSVPKPEPIAIRWRAESGFPAPAWSLHSPGWPNFPGTQAFASPKLSAWWAPTQFSAAGEVFKAPDSGLIDLRGRTVTVNGAAVTLDSITIEEHGVEVAPGERQKRTCLVVRLTHPEGNPIFARPRGITPAGREIRLYEGANKLTCLFWWPGLTEADAKTKVTGLEFVVLNDALRAAEKDGRHLTLTAPAPTDTSARPEPPTK
ncbi:VWA domain-containing protein [Gemmata sp. G18]|uniref:VWA domain-containing protein n=1 Tax=Gemmata palustris TaxID=2822762 RepID=A0ABS5BZX6_9BACT|nr:vWA domain-containing protein [Gemmata palustris]MBP3959288.1 VWA domain-containing protein [Gemmata palustris]